MQKIQTLIVPQTEDDPHSLFPQISVLFIKNMKKNGRKSPMKKPYSFLSTDRKIFLDVYIWSLAEKENYVNRR